MRHACSVEGCGYIQPAEEYATLGLDIDGPENLNAAEVIGVGSASNAKVIVIPAYNEEGKMIIGIGAGAFRNFQGEAIVIPGTVRTINADAFNGCTAEVIFESDSLIEGLENGAFRGYAGERVVLPDGLKNIGKPNTANGEVFANCGNLTIWIPDSVTFIGQMCFNNNHGMITVQFEGTQAQYDNISKTNVYGESGGNLDWKKYKEEMNVPRPEIKIPMPS